MSGCKFKKYRPVKSDAGFEAKDSLYMSMLAPCGNDVWLDDLCRDHKLVMDYAAEAKEGAVIVEGTSTDPWNDPERRRIAAQNSAAIRREKREQAGQVL